MNTVYFNADIPDDLRRRRLFDGQLFVYSASKSTYALGKFARELTEEAFAPHDPRDAQHYLPVEKYIAILTELKPKFINHPEAKRLVQDILIDFGCNPEKTHFDVPRLRTACSGDYLSSGIAYAFKPHRDTWYSPPMCQLNWWLPIYPIESENAMALHTNYWNKPLRNSSNEFNYQEWIEGGRREAASHVGKDTRRQSEALEKVEVDPQLRIVTEPDGLLIFSAAHLHSTVPNTSGRTRLSIDFRTVHTDDLAARRGAPNIDSNCTGTTIGDYLRGSDLSHVPAEIAALYGGAQIATVAN
jgi:hypothetical protein